MDPRRFVLALIGALAAATHAFAFGTIVGLGQNREHGRITEHALACATPDSQGCLQPRSLALLIGPKGDRGAVSVPDLTSMTFQASAHCDNGDYLPTPGYAHSQADARAALEACKTWMASSLEDAVARAGGLVGADGALAADQASSDCANGTSAKCATFKALGLMLHASQDFYAHTNWTDRPRPDEPIGPANPPGLGHDGPAPWISLRGDAPFPDGLMTGCFKSIPEALFCNEGPGGRVKHASLNKDEGVIDPEIGAGSTKRGSVEGNFARAVEAAIADTKDKWRLLGERLVDRYGEATGALMVCALERDDPVRDCSADGRARSGAR